MFSELKHIPEVWRQARQSKSVRNQLLFSVTFFAIVCLHNFHYLRVWQFRPGIQLNDMLLNQLPPHDFSMPIFLLEYSTVLLVFIFTLPHPDRLIKGIQMFALIILARTVTIYFVPLEPPKDMVLLLDPVANFFLHSEDVFVTKDLFFSGHISALSLLMLIAVNRQVKTWALVTTVLVAILIMWQHVHYSSDVLFAPLVSYAAYRFINYLHTQTKYGLEWQDA
jgi:hypothetical protein